MVPAILTGQKKFTQEDADTRYLQLSGGTLTGDLTLRGNPTAANMASNKAYVDAAVSDKVTTAIADSKYLAKAGGTMAGKLVLSDHPSQNLEAATKQYVDSSILDAIGNAMAKEY